MLEDHRARIRGVALAVFLAASSCAPADQPAPIAYDREPCSHCGMLISDATFAALCEHWDTRPPVMLLTAESSEETEAAAARMDAHRLIKPAPPAALRALIATALAQTRAERPQPLAESATG